MGDVGGGVRHALLGGESYRLLGVIGRVGAPEERIVLCAPSDDQAPRMPCGDAEASVSASKDDNARADNGTGICADDLGVVTGVLGGSVCRNGPLPSQLVYASKADWDAGELAFLAAREASATCGCPNPSGGDAYEGAALLPLELDAGSGISVDIPNALACRGKLLGTPAASTPVTSASPDSAKLRLFRSLFCADAKFYAHGYLNRRTGKIGYTPACANEWKPGVCPKPRTRCAECGWRELLPLTDAALVAHFRGERMNLTDVVGVYPMDKDCNVRFLAIDFDGDGWRPAVLSLCGACEDVGIMPAIERSRSGNGAHLWLFFSEAVSASLVRRLGASLLTAAMARGSIGFDSYDRMFPAQDTLPANGFGNLIALPLQGRAMREHNSCFLDVCLEPQTDQWAFLSSVRCLSGGDARAALCALGDSPLGELVGSAGDSLPDAERGGGHGGNRASAYIADGDAKLPRDSKTLASALTGPGSRKRAPLISADLPSEVRVTLGNAVFVEKAGLSPRAQDAIRRLAAFSNSEFYRAQAMRQSVFGKPRIVYYGYEDERAIALPRGCRESLVKLLEGAGGRVVVCDERQNGRPIKVTFTGELRPDQLAAQQALLAYDDGILVAPTAFGKTVLAASLIAAHSRSTLVVMQSAPLLEQWRERLEAFLSIEDNRPPLLTKSGKPSKRKRPLIGIIGGGKDKPSGIVDLALAQALFEPGSVPGLREVKRLVRGYGMVIVDECQHAAAGQTRRVLGEVCARYVYGLTATPKRNDGQTLAVPMMCGPIRHVASVREQAERQGFRRLLVPRFLVATCGGAARDASLPEAMDAVCADVARSDLIVADVCAAMGEGRTPLVLTRRLEHARKLAERLSASGKRTVLLVGDEPRRAREGRLAELRDIPAGERFVVVATGSYIGEGFDDSRFDTLFLACPVSFDSTVSQYVGRLHREAEGKRDVRVYDYVDLDVEIFAKMYRKRLRSYTHQEYEVLAEDAESGREFGGVPVGLSLVGGEPAASLMRDDIDSARRSIVISSERWSNARAGKVIECLSRARARGVDIQVRLCKPTTKRYLSSFEKLSARLSAAGCAVAGAESCGEYLVVDGLLVWYGTMSVLAGAREGDCSLRMSSPSVATALKFAFDGSPSV